MLKLMDINKRTTDGESCIELVHNYITTKNLNFIVLEGQLANVRCNEMKPEQSAALVHGYAECNFSEVTFFNGKPSPPFLAASLDKKSGTATVKYLIDFNEEAKNKTASRFYSKILGALATHFFSACSGIDKLWFPFVIEDIVGSKMSVKLHEGGTSILRS